MNLGHTSETEDVAELIAVGQVLRGGHCGVSCRAGDGLGASATTQLVPIARVLLGPFRPASSTGPGSGGVFWNPGLPMVPRPVAARADPTRMYVGPEAGGDRPSAARIGGPWDCGRQRRPWPAGLTEWLPARPGPGAGTGWAAGDGGRLVPRRRRRRTAPRCGSAFGDS